MNWGIIGAGNIANKFAKTINLMQQGEEDVNLFAVAAREESRAKDFAKEYEIDRAYGSYEELLQDVNVDAVYIATPNNLHVKHCEMALEAGKHVLCEKPFTTNTQDAKKLYALAKEKGLFIMEAFWIYFLPVLQQMKAIIADGEIGEVTYARADYGFIARGKRKDRKFDASLGGGALLDIGIYNLGFLGMVFDAVPQKILSDVHINEYGTDDFSMIQLIYSDTKKATVTTSIGLDIPRNALIVGTKGRIELPDYQKAEEMHIVYNDGTVKDIRVPFVYTGFEYEIREAVRCICNHQSSSDVYTSQQSLLTLQLLDDIRAQWGMKFPYEEK